MMVDTVCWSSLRPGNMRVATVLQSLCSRANTMVHVVFQDQGYSE